MSSWRGSRACRSCVVFFFQAEDGIRDYKVTGVQTCALPISPFEPVVEGDLMFGRGAADMKAGHAANLFALKALRRTGLQPAATVYLQSVVEEIGRASCRERV